MAKTKQTPLEAALEMYKADPDLDTALEVIDARIAEEDALGQSAVTRTNRHQALVKAAVLKELREVLK